jgi:hypothetical protein
MEGGQSWLGLTNGRQPTVAGLDKTDLKTSAITKFYGNQSMMGTLTFMSRNISLGASNLPSAVEERCCKQPKNRGAKNNVFPATSVAMKV